MKRVAAHWDLLLFLLLAAGFVLFPHIDLAASGLFYRTGTGFFLHSDPLAQLVHYSIPYIATVAPAVLGTILVLSLLPVFRRLRTWRLGAVYLLLVLGIGPGLIVNLGLKDHWGRARPAHVQEFGGDKRFTPAFVVSDQCRRNCSFVSGHAAQAFFLFAFGFATRRRYWFAAGLLFGGAVGLARIVQGKHFLSDIVFAFFVVYFVAKLLNALLLNPGSPMRRLLGVRRLEADELGLESPAD